MPIFGRGDQGRERTAAEREAARLERERRRALREGRKPPDELPSTGEQRAPSDAQAPDGPAPFDAAEPAPLEPAAPANGVPPRDADRPNGTGSLGDAADELSWEPFAHEPDPEPVPSARRRRAEATRSDPAETERSATEDETVPSRSPLDAGDPPPESADRERVASQRESRAPDAHGGDPESTQSVQPVGATRARRTVSLPRPQTEEPGHQTDSWDKPIGTVRKSRAGYQPQPGAPGMPPHRNIGVPSRTRRRWARRLVALVAILILAGIAAFAVLLFQPFHDNGYDAVVVSIPKGASTARIGDILAEKGVVDSGFFFEIRARLGGDRGKLRAGTYTLKRSMPYGDALAALTATPTSAPTIRVTLPEGPSRSELAVKVKAAGVRGSYMAASTRSSLLSPRDYGAPKGTRSLEGFLFPDTYELATRTATAKRLVNEQLKTFKREFAKVDLERAKRRNLSRYDVLIIASMIEREALVPRDRRLISAVIYNRLRKGMPLGIDATLRYRLNNWSRPLRRSELDTDSEYNTGRHLGLPPTPIGNPGLASIEAAADPANVNYLFYVVKPCGNGAHAFSSTDARFQKDVAAYNRARDKRGGKDPSRC